MHFQIRNCRMRIHILIAVLYIFCNHNFVNADLEETGTCTGDFCDEDVHNVWTESRQDSDPESFSKSKQTLLDFMKSNGISLSSLELELMLNFVDLNGNGEIEKEELEISNDSLQIVDRLVASFNRLDTDDDGKLSGDELPFNENEDSKPLSIIGYAIIVSHLDASIHSALKPFEGLSFLSPFEIKKVIASSVAVFKEKDEDESGGLNMEEYLKQVDRLDNKQAKGMSQEQKEGFFAMIDKDSDGEISYAEFQSVIPNGNGAGGNMEMNLEHVFLSADKNGDGFWSKEEFGDHLRQMVKNSPSAPVPSKDDIGAAFEKLDSDSDGRVSKEEMGAIHKEIEALQKQRAYQGFKEMDTNGDGALDEEEMTTMAKLMEERAGRPVDVKVLIKMLDKDEDGLIDVDEIQEMVQRMGKKL